MAGAEVLLAEAKARCPDLEGVRERLRSRAIHEATIRQVDTYFAIPRGRLKLREVQGYPPQLVYYERPDRAGVKTSRVLLVTLAPGAPMDELLARALGVRSRVSKVREIWRWEGVQIHLDEVEGLGTFVEFEAPVAAREGLPVARAHVRRLMDALAVPLDAMEATSYGDLVAAKRHGGALGPRRGKSPRGGGGRFDR